nr:MAG TPA: hypothetical protein [Caudoviricetes sp.]
MKLKIHLPSWIRLRGRITGDKWIKLCICLKQFRQYTIIDALYKTDITYVF